MQEKLDEVDLVEDGLVPVEGIRIGRVALDWVARLRKELEEHHYGLVAPLDASLESLLVSEAKVLEVSGV